MKFGLYSSIANPPRGEHLDRCIDETIAEAQLAEASGFDSCFFGEHHQDHDGFLPSPLIVGVGIGYQPADCRAFSVPMEHRMTLFEESVEIMRLCWAGETFSYRGKH